MNATAYHVPAEHVGTFLRELCVGRTVFGLVELGGDLHLVRADEWEAERFVLGGHRPVEPLKALVFPLRECLGQSVQTAGAPEYPGDRERIVIGVKNCDLSALQIHDYVFRDTPPTDPRYTALRDRTILVSCDCTAPLDVCFCTAVGELPYPTMGFDINLSPLPSGMLVEAGSMRGATLVESLSTVPEEASVDQILERNQLRERMHEQVTAQAEAAGLPLDAEYSEAVRRSAEESLWEEFAADCVECGACNFICCTCHCFLLSDGRSTEGEPARNRQWDSCLYRNFARVAGGANPREHRAKRLYNRFEKKFWFFPEILGRNACDGCGRCIQACTGRIDIREVLRAVLGVAHETGPIHAHSGGN